MVTEFGGEDLGLVLSQPQNAVLGSPATAQLFIGEYCPSPCNGRAPEGRRVLARLLSTSGRRPLAVVSPPTGQTWRMYYYAGAERVAERVLTNSTNNLYYLLGDHLGSTSRTVDTAGGTQSGLLYTPYGETRYSWTWGGIPTDYRFASQRLDADTSLYQMGARWFDTAIGRWIQPDTIVPDPSNPQALNRYSYVLGNPLKYTDPSGHDAIDALAYIRRYKK